jgi:hypothetical protein
MITLTAKINLLSGDNKALSLYLDNLSGSNISSELGNVVGVRKNAVNPFIFGVSKLGSGATFESKDSFQSRSGGGYYIGNQPSNENGDFISVYSITINSTEIIKNLTFAFDTANNGHPNSISVDGKGYIDDDAIFTVANLTSATSHTITISNWNTANAPLVITGIYTEVSIEIDRRNLISLESSIYDRADLKLPSFGIISNTGNIEFNDIDGEVRDYAEQLLLEKGLKCEIKLNNTLVDGASETIGVFETNEWDYDNNNRVVSVSLKDDLEEWQEINVDEISYDPRKTEHKSFKWLYEYLWELTSNISYIINGEIKKGKGNYNMLPFVYLDEQTQSVLNNTYTQYPLLKAGTLWQQWTKLCEVCQLHIYKNSDGVVVCRYNGGN